VQREGVEHVAQVDELLIGVGIAGKVHQGSLRGRPFDEAAVGMIGNNWRAPVVETD